MKPNRVLSDVAIQLNLPGIATVRRPLALRKTPENPLALPERATVRGPGVLVSGGGSRRVRSGKSEYARTQAERLAVLDRALGEMAEQAPRGGWMVTP